MSLNARMWAWAILLSVVLAAIGVAVAVVSPSGSGNSAATAIASPTASPEVTVSPEVTEAPAASESPSPAASVSPTPSASASSTAQPPASGNRDPSTIDCAKEAQLCSDVTGAMTIKDGKLQSSKDEPSGANYSGVPQTKMTSTVLKPNQQPAAGGDQVGWIKVHVDVVNNTSKTFVFPQRKVALVVTHNGKDDVNETAGPYTEVPPGGALHADFLNPETSDGTYTWRAKVWFYAK